MPATKLMSMARDTLIFAERTLGPLLDLFIRLWLAQSFFASGESLSQGVRMSSGQGVNFASLGITPSFFWFSKMRSRSFS